MAAARACSGSRTVSRPTPAADPLAGQDHMVMAGEAVCEFFDYVVGRERIPTRGAILIVDPTGQEITRWRIQPRSDCAICGRT